MNYMGLFIAHLRNTTRVQIINMALKLECNQKYATCVHTEAAHCSCLTMKLDSTFSLPRTKKNPLSYDNTGC